MIHLPDDKVSFAVMINAFNGKCAESIVEELIEIVTAHLHREKQ